MYIVQKIDTSALFLVEKYRTIKIKFVVKKRHYGGIVYG